MSSSARNAETAYLATFMVFLAIFFLCEAISFLRHHYSPLYGLERIMFMQAARFALLLSSVSLTTQIIAFYLDADIIAYVSYAFYIFFVTFGLFISVDRILLIRNEQLINEQLTAQPDSPNSVSSSPPSIVTTDCQTRCYVGAGFTLCLSCIISMILVHIVTRQIRYFYIFGIVYDISIFFWNVFAIVSIRYTLRKRKEFFENLERNSIVVKDLVHLGDGKQFEKNCLSKWRYECHRFCRHKPNRIVSMLWLWNFASSLDFVLSVIVLTRSDLLNVKNGPLYPRKTIPFGIHVLKNVIELVPLLYLLDYTWIAYDTMGTRLEPESGRKSLEAKKRRKEKEKENGDGDDCGDAEKPDFGNSLSQKEKPHRRKISQLIMP